MCMQNTTLASSVFKQIGFVKWLHRRHVMQSNHAHASTVALQIHNSPCPSLASLPPPSLSPGPSMLTHLPAACKLSSVGLASSSSSPSCLRGPSVRPPALPASSPPPPCPACIDLSVVVGGPIDRRRRRRQERVVGQAARRLSLKRTECINVTWAKMAIWDMIKLWPLSCALMMGIALVAYTDLLRES